MAIRAFVWATLLSVATFGCRNSTPPNAANGKANNGRSPSSNAAKPDDSAFVATVLSVHEGASVSESEALALGKKMEAAIAQGDTAAYARLFDLDAFGEVMFGALPQGTKMERAFREGALDGFQDAKPQVFPAMARELSKGSYTLLRVRPTDDGQRLIFRVLAPDDSLNYHEVCLARRRGEPRAVDVYIHLSGERFSETVLRDCVGLTSAEQLRSASKLQERQNEMLASVQVLKKMKQALRRGDHGQVMQLYRGLPNHQQQTKLMLLMRVRAAQALSDEEYVAAIDAYSAAFPDDPSRQLVSIDAYQLRKQYANAHEALASVGEAIGGDPHLLKIRGSLYVEEGKLDDADRMMQLAIAGDPRDLDAHWVWVAVSLARKDHSRTAKLLTTIRDEFGEELADAREVPEYAEFVKSAAYSEWIKTSPQPVP